MLKEYAMLFLGFHKFSGYEKFHLLKVAFMFRIIFITSSLLFMNLDTSACSNSSTERPLVVIQNEVSSLLKKQNFDRLDKLIAEYRNPKSLASDGQPKLIGFYQGLSIVDADCTEPQATEAEWKKRKQLLKAWQKVSKDTVATSLALASYEVQYGWHARGSGYMNTVSENGYELFKDRVENARKMLVKMSIKTHTDPQWYALMLDVAQYQSWDNADVDKIYVPAIKKFPLFFPYYFSKGATLSPKWGGSEKEFKEYVDKTVLETEKELGQTMYARLNWSNGVSPDKLKNGGIDWTRMKLGFERITQDFPDDWNRNNFSKFACLAGDFNEFRKQFEKYQKPPSVSVWGKDAGFLNICKKLARIDDVKKP